MKYSLVVTPKCKKELSKLDNFTRKKIQNWMNANLKDCENPRAFGKPLTGNKSGQWRYRIGDYRLICEIHDDKLYVLAVEIGHRRDIYD